MDIQYINISSFRGISSEAEHYYAKFVPEERKRDVAESIFEGGNPTIHCSKNLLFYPTREQAIDLIKKDNRIEGQFHKEPTENVIAKYMEDGTYRFPSILDIIKEARKMFPGSILCFALQESMDAFRKYWMRMYEAGEETKAQVEAMADALLNL